MTNRRTSLTRAALAALLLLPVAVPAAAQARRPLKLAPRATKAEISAEDLVSRLYAFADDSMMGRQAGHEGSVKATAFIAAELKRLGLVPAGDSGTYFQSVPLVRRIAGDDSRLTTDGAALALWTDFIPLRAGTLQGAPVIYGGTVRDSSTWPTAADAAGKLVVLSALGGGISVPPTRADSRFGGSAGVAVVVPDQVFGAYANFLRRGSTGLRQDEEPSTAGAMLVSGTTAQRLMGVAPAEARPGAQGKAVSGTLVMSETVLPARNVVALLPGSDPKLRGQYVAVGAHSDHVGYAQRAVDHDSLRAFNAVLRPGGLEDQPRRPTPDDQARVRSLLDSLRNLAPARADSINNGADDDGSGSMGVLEIAEAMAGAKTKPRRSMLFVWHTGEELGMLGSQWFTDHPTVPRDSIVAQVNIDMIGRGAKDDLANGGPGYLQLIGSRRLSTELGDLVEKVNGDGKFGFTFDYQFDANGHPAQYYCRSDHYMYARWGIPIVFMSTGGHRDYHMVTDEPQYIDYPHFRAVTQYIHDVALRVANLDHRVVVDKPKPDPNGECVQ
jgi:hypothetical protein